MPRKKNAVNHGLLASRARALDGVNAVKRLHSKRRCSQLTHRARLGHPTSGHANALDTWHMQHAHGERSSKLPTVDRRNPSTTTTRSATTDSLAEIDASTTKRAE